MTDADDVEVSVALRLTVSVSDVEKVEMLSDSVRETLRVMVEEADGVAVNDGVCGAVMVRETDDERDVTDEEAEIDMDTVPVVVLVTVEVPEMLEDTLPDVETEADVVTECDTDAETDMDDVLVALTDVDDVADAV